MARWQGGKVSRWHSGKVARWLGNTGDKVTHVARWHRGLGETDGGEVITVQISNFIA